jgi:hypothetical protein
MTGLELSRASIFYNAYTENLDDPSNYSVLNSSYGSTLGLPIPITSCSWLTPEREAVFVIANSVGSLLVVKLSSPEEPGIQLISFCPLRKKLLALRHLLVMDSHSECPLHSLHLRFGSLNIVEKISQLFS